MPGSVPIAVRWRGAEDSALAVEHGHRGRGIGVEGTERVGQLRGGRAVDRVTPGRAVQDNGGDRSRPLHPDRLLTRHRPLRSMPVITPRS